MRQVFLQKGNVYLQEVDSPLLGDKEILVKNHYSFISTGTEIATVTASEKSLFKKFSTNISENTNKVVGALRDHGLAGTLALIKAKKKQLLPLGYSCAGQVVHVGSRVKRFRVGDFVACAGAGIANHADVVTVPENLAVHVSDEKQLKQASLTTIGSIALQGVRRAQLQLGESVCVIGLGLIGQLTVQLVKQSGGTVFGMDLQQSRLDMAKEFGADHVFNPTQVDTLKELSFATSHHGVDTTIITAASQSGSIMQQAMHITRRKGKVVIVGDVKLDFERNPFYSKEIDLLMSCSYGPGRYDASYEKEGHDYPYPYVRWTENRNMQLFAQLVQEKKINVEPIFSYEYDVNEVEKAYAHLKKNNALGVVLSYKKQFQKEDDKESEETEPEKLKARTGKLFTSPQTYRKTDFSYSKNVKEYTPPEGRVRVGIIGAGGFCKIKLLPIISKIKQARIHSIVDVDTSNSISTARVYEAQRVSNNHLKVACDDEINAIVIATPHVLHAQQTLDALKYGKAVFVEKPAAVTFEQLKALKEHFKVHTSGLYCVDFNRSFSPFIKAVKQQVDQRTNPLIINYRMNAGFIPQDHWIQSEQNRGRIIGEACHIFELFSFLTHSNPVSVSVQSIKPAGTDMARTDNVIAQVTMKDGSCCTLTYTSLGSNKLDKEYMEIFFDGKSIVMKDYLELIGYGLPMSFNKKVKRADKGHEALLKEFFAAAKQPKGEHPLSLERIFMATELSLVVDKLARQGGGFYNF